MTLAETFAYIPRVQAAEPSFGLENQKYAEVNISQYQTSDFWHLYCMSTSIFRNFTGLLQGLYICQENI